MTDSSLDADAVHDLCRNARRRLVLAVLAEQQRTLTLDDLAKTLVTHERGEPLLEVSGETVTRLKTSLHHCHVPKLAEAGLVDYDADRGLVEPTAALADLDPHLESVVDATPELSAAVEL